MPSPASKDDQKQAQAYKEVCDDLLVVRRIPTDGTSMHEAICVKLRPEDQIVVWRPSVHAIKSWLREAKAAGQTEPFKNNEVWLRQWQDGIFPLPVGELFQSISVGSTDEYDEPRRSQQRAAWAYVDECGSFMGLFKTLAQSTDLVHGIDHCVVAELPTIGQMRDWMSEHFADRTPETAEIKLVQYKGGLYPFAAHAFALLAGM